MARALSQIIIIIAPNIIVLGDGLSNVDRFYHNIPGLWRRWVLSKYANNTQLVRAKHGDSCGVRGTACLWPQQ